MSSHRAEGRDPAPAAREGDAGGHRLISHTADVIVDSWGPDREACLRGAVLGMVAGFTDTRGVRPRASLALSPEPASDEETLLRLLEEVIYIVEVRRMVPVDVAVQRLPSGGVSAVFRVAPLEPARNVGALPKGVSWHGLHVGLDPDGIWRARVLLDV